MLFPVEEHIHTDVKEENTGTQIQTQSITTKEKHMNIQLGDWVKGQLVSSYTRHLPPSYVEGLVVWINEDIIHVLDGETMKKLVVATENVVEHRQPKRNNNKKDK